MPSLPWSLEALQSACCSKIEIRKIWLSSINNFDGISNLVVDELKGTSQKAMMYNKTY